MFIRVVSGHLCNIFHSLDIQSLAQDFDFVLIVYEKNCGKIYLVIFKDCDATSS